MPQPGIPSGKEELTVSSAAVGFASIPATADHAVVTVETDQFRFWFDGSTPTASSGHLASIGDMVVLEGRQEVLKFRAIRVTTDSALKVTYNSGTQ